MTEYICGTDSICFEQKREQATTNPKSKIFSWNGLQRLVEALGNHAIEIYRCNKITQPEFSNGGTRVLIRPDRIDLA